DASLCRCLSSAIPSSSVMVGSQPSSALALELSASVSCGSSRGGICCMGADKPRPFDRSIAARADIDYLAFSHARAFRGQKVGPHDIVDVSEIAGLRTVARNRQWHATQPLLDKFGDHQGIGSLGWSAWSVDIEIAQAYRWESIHFTEQSTV